MVTQLDRALEAYSDLLVRAVANTICLDPAQNKRNPKLTHQLYRRIAQETPEHRLIRLKTRLEGRDWPAQAHSMAGVARLRNLANCVHSVLREGAPGAYWQKMAQ